MPKIIPAEPASIQAGPDPVRVKAALRRCCSAWRRTYDAAMAELDGGQYDPIFAANDARKSYCNAMPVLNGYQSIWDFIACATYGILIETISAPMGNQLLDAARIALAARPRDRKPTKRSSK